MRILPARKIRKDGAVNIMGERVGGIIAVHGHGRGPIWFLLNVMNVSKRKVWGWTCKSTSLELMVSENRENPPREY